MFFIYVLFKRYSFKFDAIVSRNHYRVKWISWKFWIWISWFCHLELVLFSQKCSEGIAENIIILFGNWSLEPVTMRCSVKKVFLKILWNSQENISARVSFLIKLHCNFVRKETLAQGISCEFCEIFQENLFLLFFASAFFYFYGWRRDCKLMGK